MNNKHKIVTVLIGYKRKSGKDTFADMLETHLQEIDLSYDIHAFADPIKKLLCSVFGITLEELNLRKNSNDKTIRSALVNFSKTTTEMFGNLWVKYINDKRNISIDNKKDLFIVTDFRLIEEFDYLSKDDELVITINIKRRDFTSDTRTETELDDYEFDIVIDNSKERTLDDLDLAAKEVAGLLEAALVTMHIKNNDTEWVKERSVNIQ